MPKVSIITGKKHENLINSIRENVLNSYKQTKVINEKGHILELEFTQKKKEIMSLLALTISSYITVHIDDVIVRDVVENECFDLGNNDIEYLIAGIKTAIIQDGDLYAEILFLLDQDKNFNLNGYLQFRNSDRKKDIKEISYHGIDEFFANQEIEGFVQIVQRFLYIQKPKTDYVHIIENQKGDLRFITAESEEIDLIGLRKELEENLVNIDYEINDLDLILSSLLSILPKKVYLHFPFNIDEEMKFLLKRVLDGKYEECESCDFCEDMKKDLNKQD